MKRKIIINVERQEKRVAILEDGSLEQYFVERPGEERIVGNVYKAKVQNVVSGIQAAFLDLGLEMNGFLYISDITKPFADYKEIIEEEAEELEPARFKEDLKIQDVLKSNQDVLVQVVKGHIGTKGPRLTTNISLPGRYVVLMPYQKCFGISKKISNPKERERLKDIIKSFRLPNEAGLIVRTMGEGASKKEFIRDYKYLMNLLKKIEYNFKKQNSPALIHQEYDLVLRVVRDYFSEEVESLIVDDKKETGRISHFLNSLAPQLKSRLSLHKEKTPLFEKFNLEKQIERIYKRRVNLKSGGYLVIEPTEAMVTIDVNTGSFIKKESLQETVYITNKEAAHEIARQIKLRDLGGIIVIDFIDMKSRRQREEVSREFTNALKTDRAKTKVLPVSELGVVEMTRQRVGKSLESVSFKICPRCQGKGRIKTIPTVAIDAVRSLKRYIKSRGAGEYIISVNPEVANFLYNQARDEIFSLEKRHGASIRIKADKSRILEEIEIEKA
jgi:Rne/Rng family ribonuclease